ncbi:unnamed protein product [Rotaria sordida]|uniref:Protein kinase domain-containing protein n=1 Tax=Rotaria sordida TaxID=392033 RepID=A0A819TFX8_9BILA|nr:unnamed protein product [Rotaria sordida]
MICLASNHVVHGDLACRNVLVFRFDENQPERSVVKITDFGLSRHSQLYSRTPGAARTTLNIVPIRYAAPEVLSSNATSEAYTEKSDVYSMGVLMWEAYSRGSLPWMNIERDDEFWRPDGKYRKKYTKRDDATCCIDGRRRVNVPDRSGDFYGREGGGDGGGRVYSGSPSDHFYYHTGYRPWGAYGHGRLCACDDNISYFIGKNKRFATVLWKMIEDFQPSPWASEDIDDDI